MNINKGKYAWMVKIGEKGQFVIPKEARELFNLQPGDEILVLGDKEKGIAILPKEKQQNIINLWHNLKLRMEWPLFQRGL